MRYGYIGKIDNATPQDGDRLLAVQSAESYANTPDEFKSRWFVVPDDIEADAVMVDGEWVNPEPVAPTGRMRAVSKFMTSLGLPNLVGIQAAANDPNDQRRPVAQVMIQFTNVTPYVGLDDDDTAALLDALIAAEFITEEDKARALS
jgi:hypothetical protein